MGSEYFLRSDLEISREFLFYRFEKDQKCLKDSKNSFENNTQNIRYHVCFDVVKYLVVFFPKPLKVGIFSVSGKFIEDYSRNLTCWEKSKN
jgi:hypothetical protein